LFMKLICLFLAILILSACNHEKQPEASSAEQLDRIFRDYDEEHLKLFPLEATSRGDSRYDDLLNIEFTRGFRDSLNDHYSKYLQAISGIDTAALDESGKTFLRVFQYELETNRDSLRYPFHFIPFQQFDGVHLVMGQLGAGESSQPFKTTTDYENWMKRVGRFPAWADSAIVYFRHGIDSGIVLPKALVLKMIPQLRALAKRENSIFFAPLNKLPESVRKDSARIAAEFQGLVVNEILPSYTRLANFLEKDYLPAARSSSGVSSLPGGKAIYDYSVRYWTTTAIPAEEIYQKGLQEVSRIRNEMEKLKQEVGFKGDLAAFFEFMKTDRQFMPFRTAEEVLDSFRAIQRHIEPHLDKMFGRRPKTAFAIRQTEDFRAASASAEYQQGTPDGSRPGIFYLPILDARTFNTTSGMESLFLHEAIPGHHYQISLQQENEKLPAFMRFGWYGAFGEGWALYCESLGKELGLYTNPYQHMGALGDEIHRAIRLVVDVGIHLKGMSREEAIRYMMENEAISLEGATSEIERYMAWPGQALSYKIGSMEIAAMRNQYETQLGKGFSLASFHDEFLKDGVMPLAIAKEKMERWAEKQKANK
jgi:uncharacterized protein (DUF885 family)